MPNLKQIEHIVVLMLENRSFDNVFGWLYDPANPALLIGNRRQTSRVSMGSTCLILGRKATSQPERAKRQPILIPIQVSLTKMCMSSYTVCLPFPLTRLRFPLPRHRRCRAS